MDKDRLWGHLRYLCEKIGPRLSGTPSDEKSVAYIAAQFRQSGAHVTVQDFPCPGWDHEGTTLALRDGNGAQSLPAVAQTFTEGCDVEADLAVVGTRHDLEFRPDLEGRILVVHAEAADGLAMNRNVGLQAIEERRPVAAIVVAAGEDVSSKLVRDPFLRVPVAAIPASAGRILLEKQGSRAHLSIRARRYESTGHNVIGHFPGREKGRVVVGAHYDTAAGTTGAYDDGSGTAILLELAQALGGAGGRRYGIDLIAFGAEEYGRHLRALGSVEYVRRHAGSALSARAMIQVDSVGSRGCVPLAHMMGWQADQKEGLLRVLRRFPRNAVDEEPVSGSDHVPFHLHGVPVLVFMNDYRTIPIHTPLDSIDLMDPDELAYTAQVVEAVTRHCAGTAG